MYYHLIWYLRAKETINEQIACNSTLPFIKTHAHATHTPHKKKKLFLIVFVKKNERLL